MDLIDRQDAIDAVSDCGICIQKIVDLPSAQKKGKWFTLIDTNPYYTTWRYGCSECGQYPLRDGYGQEVLSDYCPNCGIRMIGEEE